MTSLAEKLRKSVGENDMNQDVSGFLTTGLLELDYAVSGKYRNGGLPQGRIIEIYGPESSGKTLLATMALKKTQELGGIAAFLDYEHAFSMSRAKTLGLSDDPLSWFYKQPTTAEEGFDFTLKLCEVVVREGLDKPVTIVKDSVASMLTKAEFEADPEDVNMKTRLSLASCMSTNLKKIAGAINRSNITLVFLNQVRDNPGVMFGDKEITPGGKALKFFSSVRIKLSKGAKIKEDGDKGPIIGEHVTAMVVKNKVFSPFRQAEYISAFSEGVNLYRSHIDLAMTKGLMENKGGWIEFDGKKYRMKDLEAHFRTDSAAYQGLLDWIRDNGSGA